MTPTEITRDGLWDNNPALVQLLGLCPLLAVSNTLINGFVLGSLTLLVLICSNGAISLLQRWLDDTTRLPAQILIIATFVTLADLLLQFVSFELHQRIGLFVALIVTNCVILGRAEAFARKNHFGYALLDGLTMGSGFLLVIVLLSAIREALGHGTLFAQADLIFGEMAVDWVIQLPNEGLLLAILPPGAFLLFGLLIALKNWIDQKIEQRQALRNSETAAS
jgi:electron transport complex protein RnfE